VNTPCGLSDKARGEARPLRDAIDAHGTPGGIAVSFLRAGDRDVREALAPRPSDNGATARPRNPPVPAAKDDSVLGVADSDKIAEVVA